MPMFTMSEIFFPVYPFHSPEMTFPEKSFIFFNTAFTCGMTSSPST